MTSSNRMSLVTAIRTHFTSTVVHLNRHRPCGVTAEFTPCSYGITMYGNTITIVAITVIAPLMLQTDKIDDWLQDDTVVFLARVNNRDDGITSTIIVDGCDLVEVCPFTCVCGGTVDEESTRNAVTDVIIQRQNHLLSDGGPKRPANHPIYGNWDRRPNKRGTLSMIGIIKYWFK